MMTVGEGDLLRSVVVEHRKETRPNIMQRDANLHELSLINDQLLTEADFRDPRT